MCAGCISHVDLSLVFSISQEVAVKEQLTGKGKLNRRSISSPSMNRVSPAAALDRCLPPPFRLPVRMPFCLLFHICACCETQDACLRVTDTHCSFVVTTGPAQVGSSQVCEA